MTALDTKKEWEEYCRQEIETLRPFLRDLSFELDAEQVHIGGERYAFSEKKLVLLAKHLPDRLPVIIKVSNDLKGIQEIKKERQSRAVMAKINFAYHVFYSPTEIFYQEQNGRVIFITKYIEQDCQFLDRPLLDQFFLALKGLEVQEGVQVTTYEHARSISKHFGVWQAKDYLDKFSQYQQEVSASLIDSPEILSLYQKAKEFLNSQAEIIELYSGFLTHWDFVPHNIRVQGNNIYLLDHSSIRFGNKYESWARFINFMSMHNPDLEKALLFYVQKNRSQSEYASLQAMRVFRLTEIIWHYANTLSKVEGDLLVLNKLRIKFYMQLLTVVLINQYLEPSVVKEYLVQRDSLRSDTEKLRQKNLH
jgi:hypothetical protein